jgi:hypothetical protein
MCQRKHCAPGDLGALRPACHRSLKPSLTQATLGQLTSRSRPVATEPGRKPRVSGGSNLNHCTTQEAPQLLILVGRPALGMIEATVFLGPSMLHTFFGTLPQICSATQSCLRVLWTIPSTSWLGFCSDMHCQLWDLIYTGVCLSKSSPIN